MLPAFTFRLNVLKIVCLDHYDTHEVQVPIEGGRVVDEAVVAERAAEPACHHAQQIPPLK